MKKYLLAALIGLCFICTNPIYSQDAPPPRWGHSMVAIDGELYVFGGALTLNPLYVNKLWRLDPSSGWQREEPVTSSPPVRASHEAVAAANKMFAMFGENDDGLLDDIWEYNPKTKTWRELPSNGDEKPPARKHFSAVSTDDGILITCGMDTEGNFLVDNWLYHLDTGVWERKQDPWPSHSPYGMTSQVVDDILYLFGGVIGGSEGYYSDILIYDIKADHWSDIIMAKQNQDYYGNLFGVSALLENKAVLIGGGFTLQNPSSKGTDWKIFDPADSSITFIPEGPTVIHPGMASLRNKPHLFGGIENETLTPIFMFYDPLEKHFVDAGHDSTSSVKATVNPQEFDLLQSYPNPFNPVTNISYTITKASPVELSIYNPLGQLLITLVSERQSAGRYTCQWHANNHGGSLYICRLTTDQFQKSIKVALLK